MDKESRDELIIKTDFIGIVNKKENKQKLYINLIKIHLNVNLD